MIALVGWVLAPQAAKAQNVCTGAGQFTPCPDIDNDPCTRAACDGAGNCDQRGLFAGQFSECPDTDNDPCTRAACDGVGNCNQGQLSAGNGAECPDTDNDPCTRAACDGAGSCNQRQLFAGNGAECLDTDDDPCTRAACDGAGNCNQRQLFAGTGATCPDTDDEACTRAACDGAGTCNQRQFLAGQGASCPDTDGEPCTIAACDGAGTCNQRQIPVSVGASCPDTDGNPCTIAACDAQPVCQQIFSCTDISPPVLTCPAPITLERGDKICNDDVKRWLDSVTATDVCDPEPTITNDAPECGFPPGSTTTVTFTAEDDCENTATCTSDITIAPLRRGAGDQKGSLLAFSKIEIKWDADGNLIQDTLLDVSNDADLDGVEIQAYFVNGDRQLEEQTNDAGDVVQEFEPGWNTADCRFHLTKNQPHFWSAAKGSSKCQPFTVLDESGRLDSEATDGTRLLRGFVIMWAVKFIDPRHNGTVQGLGENGYWEEIRWNHLKGDAVIVNYRLGSAWEYNVWAYQARCGETGEPLLDCLAGDGAGTCCSAEPVPGKLRLDGFQYDINFDELLMDFYASGSTGFSSTNVGVMVDTDLTLHSMDVDVRQDGEGPILTKAEFEIFNENESKFSGTRRCICCWDQTLLSNYVRTVAVPNHFLRSKLGTNKGYARINGVRSTECDYTETCGLEPRMQFGTVAGGNPDLSRDTALAGLSFKILTFTGAGTNIEWAGGNLHGSGEQSSTIRVDVEQGSGEAQGAR